MPPRIHCVNVAKLAIRTWKDRFIAGLVSIDTQFPVHLWFCLIPQATMTLNVLRLCRKTPTMLVYTAIEEPFDFSKTPLAPPGTKMLVHKKLQQQKTWGIYGIPGWYIGL